MTSPLLTDLYQLTMGYGYWRCGMAEREAVFHLFFRRPPFGDEAVITGGIAPAVDYLASLRFTDEELGYLGSLTGADDQPLFEQDYLDYLHELDWSLTVHGIPEGELALPHEPLLRVQGPLLQCQVVETALLNLVNFQTLIATKAARICAAAGEDPVIEFGLRRAQGPDGGLSATRAAYLGGCAGTSNVLAGMQFGIPVKGTHAHSWVMSFDQEEDAFDTYARAMPNNAILLVDTYDTLEGVRNAIATGHQLREKGHELLGIRLDSGDLVALSRDARKLLDEAGFPEAKIVASNDLDEYAIAELKAAGARIDIWGIGTKLATAYDQPALGGVYKLGAIRNSDGDWQYRVKLSNDLIKVSNPGIIQVNRTVNEEGQVRDILFNEADHNQPTGTPLLVPLLQHGARAADIRPLPTARERALESWNQLCNSPSPEVCLDPKLEETKRTLLRENGFQP